MEIFVMICFLASIAPLHSLKFTGIEFNIFNRFYGLRYNSRVESNQIVGYLNLELFIWDKSAFCQYFLNIQELNETYIILKMLKIKLTSTRFYMKSVGVIAVWIFTCNLDNHKIWGSKKSLACKYVSIIR